MIPLKGKQGNPSTQSCGKHQNELEGLNLPSQKQKQHQTKWLFLGTDIFWFSEKPRK